MKRLLLLLAVMVAVGSCGGDDPVKPPVLPQNPYPDASTPQNVVQRYAIAWARRDSIMIDSVLAADYTGSSLDATDPSPTVLAFTKSDEIRVVANMASDPSIHVDVNLSPSAWVLMTDLGDPPGWVDLMVPTGRVEVDDGDQAHIAELQGTHFKLKPTTPAPGSPTDTTWTIVRWTEMKIN